MKSGKAFEDIIIDALLLAWEKTVVLLPHILGALLILLVGWLLAHGIRRLVEAGLSKVGLDKAAEVGGVSDVLERLRLPSASQLTGLLIYWTLLLVTFISAADALGLEEVSKTLDTAVAYLPNVVAAALVFVLGTLAAHVVVNITQGALERMHIDVATELSRILQGVLLLIVSIVAIAQLKIETTLLNILLGVILASAGLGLALALGLGARDLAANIIAGIYSRERYLEGTRVSVDGIEGELLEVGRVSAIVKTKSGESHIPNRQLLDHRVDVSSDS